MVDQYVNTLIKIISKYSNVHIALMYELSLNFMLERAITTQYEISIERIKIVVSESRSINTENILAIIINDVRTIKNTLLIIFLYIRITVKKDKRKYFLRSSLENIARLLHHMLASFISSFLSY
jgi:uncharacterized protein (UPF0216 family)